MQALVLVAAAGASSGLGDRDRKQKEVHLKYTSASIARATVSAKKKLTSRPDRDIFSLAFIRPKKKKAIQLVLVHIKGKDTNEGHSTTPPLLAPGTGRLSAEQHKKNTHMV